MTDDLISRQAAINTVFSMCCRWNTDDPNDLKNMLLTAFQDLPSACQHKWLKIPTMDGWEYICDKCGAKMMEGENNVT